MNIKYPKNTIFVTGTARPIKEDVINNVYQVLSLSLVIDKNTNIILDADATTILDITRNFLKEILIGKDFIEDIKDIEQELRDRFFALIQKPLIASLKDAHNKYRMIIAK